MRRPRDPASSRGTPQRCLLFAAVLLCSIASGSLAGEETRRVAFRLADPLLAGSDAQRLKTWSQRSGIRIDIAPIGVPVPAGFEAVFVAVSPAADAMRRMLAKFPVQIQSAGFSFDGRLYRGAGDAIALTDPARPAVTIVLGNGARASWRLVFRRVFWGDARMRGYQVVSGELTKEGRFSAQGGNLSIDRPSDRDEIATEDAFLKSFQTHERAGVRWRFRDADAGGIARWEPVLRRFLAGKKVGPILVRIFPDASAKARMTGSSRPADLSRDGAETVVDVDLSAPAHPDCVTPVFASAASAAQDSRQWARPLLLAAVGARAAGQWWGRDIVGFAAFLRAARVEPSVDQVIGGDEDVSPLFAVGAAASWLEAGARTEGEPAVRRALGETRDACERTLSRWAARADAEPVQAPARRPLPPAFLRGISYSMTNSIAGNYASPRSRDTLARLARIFVNAVSIMPYAWQEAAGATEISFVQRNPQGETDEGTVRAVSDARSLGMTAMIKPQIWIGGGQFVGEVAMKSEEQWGRWFDAYRRFIVHNAIVTEASGAALFCVGTELSGTEARRREWLDTIGAVRLATGAPLTYASNWAVDAPHVSFWDSVDAIGVDFYDSLSADPRASDEDLAAGVRRAAAPLADLSKRTGKPVLFTEAGYPPVRGAWIEPHDENTGRPPAPGDAARAIAAVFRALQSERWWKGVYWWKAFSDGRGARPGERGFNLLGSASEKAIADGFARMAAEKRAAR